MTAAGCVAVVSPREERRNSARAWAPLLRGRAEIRLCAHPGEAVDADVIALDEACPDAAEWRARLTGPDDRHRVVVFGSPRSGQPDGVAWGAEGEEVLAVVSDLLDRQRLVGDSDALVTILRASGERIEEHRRRLASLAGVSTFRTPAADDRVALARDVERLTRLATIARFLAAPSPDEGFAARLVDVLVRALGAPGAALAHRHDDGWRFEGRHRLSEKAARELVPDPGQEHRILVDRECSTRIGRGFWIPFGEPSPAHALVGIARVGDDPRARLGEAALEELRSLLADAMRARATTSALLQRKAQSERAIQTLHSGLLKMDAEGRVVLVNPALATMLETSPSQLEGQPLDLVLPRDPHVVEMLRAVLTRADALDDVETFVTSSGGRRVPVSLRASALGESDRPPEGVLVLLSDLARRKELEEEVRKAERLAALGRLSAGVAHEIRNPLAGIRTTAELLRGRVGRDAELARFVDVILEETERLDRIVTSLLQFAKPASPRRTPLRVAELLARAARLAAGRASERGVALRVLEPPPDLVILGDRDQLLQVLLNLSLNAADATPSGGEVVLEARPEGDELRLTVEDGGEGVPASLRDRVFDPFFTTKPGGTGLGLSISQNILRQHGGRLRLERPDGGRSRAAVTLPRHAPPSEPEPGGATWRTS